MENTPKEVLQKRKLRAASFSLKDLEESKDKIQAIGIICLLFGVIWLISHLILQEHSLPHSLLSLAVGAFLIIGSKLKLFQNLSSTIVLLISYLAVFIIAYLVIGFPSRIMGGFGETDSAKLMNIITVINDITPILYYGIQLVFSYILMQIIYYYTVVAKIPQELIDKARNLQ